MGLDIASLKAALENGSYTDDVRADTLEAQQLGISGVLFSYSIENMLFLVSAYKGTKLQTGW